MHFNYIVAEAYLSVAEATSHENVHMAISGSNTDG